MQEIDESLYSRQLYVLGHEAMQKMLKSKVLIIGCDGLGQEIAKNICLAGINELHILDNECIKEEGICTSFFFKKEDIGKRRDVTFLPHVKMLNPYVNVKIVNEININYESIICVNKSIDYMIECNNKARENEGTFIGCQVKGLFSQVFCDFNDSFYVLDPTGETMSICNINDIDENGILTTVENERHNLEDGDVIKISENGIYENEIFEVKVINPFKLQLLDNKVKTVAQGGIFEQQKKAKTMSFLSLKESMINPSILDFDYEFPKKPRIIHNCFMTLNTFINEKSREPYIRNDEDATYFYNLYEKLFGKEEEMFINLIKTFSKQVRGQFMPIISVIGGFVAQEALKACSSKFTPLNQFFYFDSINLFDESYVREEIDDKINQPIIDLIGINNFNKIKESNVFVVGAGAIGCEHLKNLSMIGFGTKGNIFITDMDSIEHSNLNRQFLFRKEDVGKMKAETAAKKVMNNKKVNIKHFNSKVGKETESIFNEVFFNNLTFVANALDNVESRIYMDNTCIFYRKALFDSGTLGTKGNTQVILPFLTESYSSSQDPPEKSIPLCTIQNFPSSINHTIEWSLNKFKELFNDNVVTAQSEGTNILSKEDCIDKSIEMFYDYFYFSVKKLLIAFPVDHITSEGVAFWNPPKRPPTPVDLNLNDELHLLFLLSCSNILSHAYCINENISLNEIKERVNVLSNKSVSKEDILLIDDNFTDEDKILKVKYSFTQANKEKKVLPIEFEKDIDSNYHVDFVYSSANLRANNYKISNGTKHSIKGIAGRIIPAIATTTAIVSGLSTLEMIKYVMGLKLDDFKNTFINLALPFFSSSTPLECKKNKYFINDHLKGEYDIWSRIELKNQTIKELIDYFKEKEVIVEMIFIDNKTIYSSFDKPNKNNLNELISKFSNKKIIELVILFECDYEEFPSVVVINE